MKFQLMLLWDKKRFLIVGHLEMLQTDNNQKRKGRGEEKIVKTACQKQSKKILLYYKI